ncbi:glycosyltransferase [Helicobacter apodemus]|uniref:Glycosyltransferase n=1 Tax=Helicobacter apodemus TaxID=135569 RepID=A0A4U8UDU6_9HELI|nr:glycosyltransferase family 4 protein [Helicobacter apodemus]TLE15011.1 glycosyltransferase [Helicobacter apodemus]
MENKSSNGVFKFFLYINNKEKNFKQYQFIKKCLISVIRIPFGMAGILSIRPFASKKYANDLSVKAILELSNKSFFKELEFLIIGDGELFEETLKPLRAFQNVTIHKKFLRQEEIAKLHKEYGIFLNPTRMDSQGVSRDEAGSSGLVPVTNRVAAIPEFVDEDCGILVEAEDYVGLANAIEFLYKNPKEFLKPKDRE